MTVCAGNDVKAIINGKLLNEITECTVTAGFVGIQSEGADFEIRKMYLEPRITLTTKTKIKRSGVSKSQISLVHKFSFCLRC